MTDNAVKTFVKESIETGIEQITGPKQKPQSQQTSSQQPQQKKTTAGLSDQLSGKKIFNDILKQGGGVDPDKAPTDEEIKNMKEADQKDALEKRRKIEEEELGIKTIPPQQPRGNMEVINPPRPQQQEVPEYIRGKPGYDPEKQAKMQEEAKKLPPLEVPKGKPPRGSWISAMERKKHGAEIKGGRE